MAFNTIHKNKTEVIKYKILLMEQNLLLFQLQMAIVITTGIFPFSCICVVYVLFPSSTKRKESYGNQSTIWYSTPDL